MATAIPPAVSDWLTNNYPRPHVDPEWLEACYDWLTTDQNHSPTTNLPALLSALESQLLQSNLCDSMLHGTGIPINLALPTSIDRLVGPPILVEITAITEIGTSAFQLDQIRRAREERINSGVGNEEGEEDGDVEVEGEGPMPKYSRSMLRLELTDGVTILQAIEHRHLKELDLGKTPLGYKIQLKSGMRIHRGMAFLEPEFVIMKGGKTEDRDVHRERDFARGLRVRMQLPVEPLEDEDQEQAPPPPAAAVAAVRSPLREISSPPSPPHFPQHNDDEDLEPRRRKLPTHHLNSNSAPKPSSSSSPMLSTARSSTLVASTGATTSAYFASASTSSSSRTAGASSSSTRTDLDFRLSPTTRSTAPLPSRARSPSIESANPGFDFDFLDEVDAENQAPPPPAPPSIGGKGKAREAPASSTKPKPSTTQKHTEPDPDSDDFWAGEESDGLAMDVEFLEGVDKLEMEALGRSQAGGGGGGGFEPPSSGSGSGGASGSSMYDSSYAFVSPISRSAVNGFEDEDEDGVEGISGWGQPRGTTATTNTRGTSSSSQPRPRPAPMDVITIDSDREEDGDAMDVEDKENVPVATRHVRRRTVGSVGGLGEMSQRGGVGRPVVRATDPGDIIDISDSD